MDFAAASDLNRKDQGGGSNEEQRKHTRGQDRPGDRSQSRHRPGPGRRSIEEGREAGVRRTNACLRAIERRPKRVLPIDYAPAADPHEVPADPVSDPIWLEPYPDSELGLEGPVGPDVRYEQREGVELAFIAALQHLPAQQRAVLILRDVLGFSARETAEVLETTPVSVDSALQRAHKTGDGRPPGQTQQQTLHRLGDDELGELVERYVNAWERNDVDAVVAMLAEDAKMTMPPLPSWYSGREQVAAFLGAFP